MNAKAHLFKQARSIPIPFVGTLVCSLGVGFCTIAQAWFLSQIIHLAFLEHLGREELIPVLSFLLIATLFRVGFSWLKEYAAFSLSFSAKATIRKKLLRHIGDLGPAFLKGERTGELSTTLTEGIETLDAWFSEYLPQVFLSAIIPILFLCVVFPTDWLSGLVLLLTAPIIPILMILIGQTTKALNQQQFQALSQLGAHYLDILQGLLTLKLFGQSKNQADRIAKVSDLFRTKTLGVLKVAFISALALELIATIATAVVAVEIGVRLLYGKMAFQPALFILILAPEFYMPLRLLGSRFHAGQEGVAAALRIFSVFDQTAPSYSASVEGDNPSEVDKAPSLLSVKNLTFNYLERDVTAVNQVSFELIPKRIYALTGPSGAGKSTLVQLILKDLMPDQGDILYQGKSIYDDPSQHWNSKLSYVPQHPYLFADSIRENLRLSNPSISDEAILEALKSVGLNDLVASMPRQLDHPIGERGNQLSGGQVQRLSLARAILKDAPLLILDEVTSQLDLDSETAIHHCLHQLQAHQTILIIAHRLKTLEFANEVLFLKDGKLHAQGSHASLISSHNAYSQWLQEELTQ